MYVHLYIYIYIYIHIYLICIYTYTCRGLCGGRGSNDSEQTQVKFW